MKIDQSISLSQLLFFLQQPSFTTWILMLLQFFLPGLSYCYGWCCLLFEQQKSSSIFFSFFAEILLYYFLSSTSISPPAHCLFDFSRAFLLSLYLLLSFWSKMLDTHVVCTIVFCPRVHLLYTWDLLLHIFLFPTFYLFCFSY